MKLVLLLLAGSLTAQDLTITQAVERAVDQYPSIRVNDEQLRAAAAGIQLARLAYLPKADAIAQVNRATRNNIYGLLLPQQVLSPISGPPNPNNTGTNVWGSAIGFLVSWEPFDFGLRQSAIGVNESAARRAQALVKRTRFEVASLAAHAYLTVLASTQALAVAEVGKARLTGIAPLVKSLVDSGLRPGIDSTRLLAEEAEAETQLIQARSAVQLSISSLANLLNLPEAQVTLARMHFLDPAPPMTATADMKSHPAALEQSIAQEESAARLKTIERSYYPKFNAQATAYARGTGSPATSLGPNIYNWGIGFSVTYSLMDLPGLRVKKEIEVSLGRAEQARYERLLRELEGQRSRARIETETALQLARNTPIQVEAARAVQEQIMARYKAGLIPMLEVVDAQRALSVAQIDDSLARLSIWRAQLALAVAQGDLTDFLARAEKK